MEYDSPVQAMELRSLSWKVLAANRLLREIHVVSPVVVVLEIRINSLAKRPQVIHRDFCEETIPACWIRVAGVVLNDHRRWGQARRL